MSYPDPNAGRRTPPPAYNPSAPPPYNPNAPQVCTSKKNKLASY